LIVIAEDDDGHAELIREGLVSAGVHNRVLRFSNGQEAWDYFSVLRNCPERIGETAHLLLLDINMPIMDGVEVLKRMKEDPVLREIPVIMLTTTDDPREIEQCYKVGCNVYVTKPVDFTRFAETLKRLGLFLQIVKV